VNLIHRLAQRWRWSMTGRMLITLRNAMFKALRLIADAAWSDETSTFSILLIFALIGLAISFLAALNGLEMVAA
jgi:hypothetical protein